MGLILLAKNFLLARGAKLLQARQMTDANGLAVGDWVLALTHIIDVGPTGAPLENCRPGDIGHIIDLRADYLPTIAWERSGTVCDAEPGTEFDLLCGPDFARTPETTPKSPGASLEKKSNTRA